MDSDETYFRLTLSENIQFKNPNVQFRMDWAHRIIATADKAKAFGQDQSGSAELSASFINNDVLNEAKTA